MPIRGLTDTVRPAFTTIGKLRKGGEAKRTTDGKMIKMGDDLSYFRFTSDQPEVVEAFADAYGRTPALVRAYLPYALVDENFSCWKEAWSQGGLVHRCDGQTMAIWLDDKGKYQRAPRPCDGGCDEVGRLTLIIPELLRAGYVGYVCLETHGLNDLLSIQACLLAAFASRMGNPLGLRGIEWNVRRVKEKISTPMGNGKRARRDKWLVKIEPAADWVQLQLEQAHATTMALPAPNGVPERVIDPETGEVMDTRDDDYQEEDAEVEAQPEQPAETAAPGPAPVEAVQPANPTPAPVKTLVKPDPNGRPSKGILTRWHELYREAADLGVQADDLVFDPNKVNHGVAYARAHDLAGRIETAREAAASGTDEETI